MPTWIMRRNHCANYAFDARAEAYTGRLADSVAGWKNAFLADPLRALCEGTSCRAQIDDTNLFSDEHHLTRFASYFVVQRVVGPAVLKALALAQ
jgi:hypothetical protein